VYAQRMLPIDAEKRSLVTARGSRTSALSLLLGVSLILVIEYRTCFDVQSRQRSRVTKNYMV
jgi:hypothetical protein